MFLYPEIQNLYPEMFIMKTDLTLTPLMEIPNRKGSISKLYSL